MFRGGGHGPYAPFSTAPLYNIEKIETNNFRQRSCKTYWVCRRTNKNEANTLGGGGEGRGRRPEPTLDSSFRIKTIIVLRWLTRHLNEEVAIANDLLVFLSTSTVDKTVCKLRRRVRHIDSYRGPAAWTVIYPTHPWPPLIGARALPVPRHPDRRNRCGTKSGWPCSSCWPCRTGSAGLTGRGKLSNLPGVQKIFGTRR